MQLTRTQRETAHSSYSGTRHTPSGGAAIDITTVLWLEDVITADPLF